ncbi:hypothetical protein CUR178_04017 [Leishmania enriettii]|uniref:Transmembrane protein n=1 Tax=Leishmania enriettii TaxID=5663 RepID=A0A836HFG2_LEIEN|nr:hypothetical protein CUR178_04017 [Leishmania enriettii]
MCGGGSPAYPPPPLRPRSQENDGGYTGKRAPLCFRPIVALRSVTVAIGTRRARRTEPFPCPFPTIMRLRRRGALLLCAAARRTAASVGSSRFPFDGAAGELSSPAPPGRRSADSTSGTVALHGAAVPAANASAVAVPQPHSHQAPPRAVCGKEGDRFTERLRASDPGAASRDVPVFLTAYVLAASTGLLCVFYYFTTHTYILTTNTSPHRNSLYFHFPCDMAIIENRITHRRHTVEVEPVAAPRQLLGFDGHGEAGQVGCHRPKPAIVERRLRINSVLYRVLLYLQKTESFVTVDAQAELEPFRFMDGANSIGRASRASVGFLREDQLLPDIKDSRASTEATRRRWWQWSGERAKLSAASAAPTAPTRILLKSSVRLRDATNGYQKGCKSVYERFIHHVAQEKIKQRYYAYVLAKGTAQKNGMRRVYAEELIRNGLLSGDGVTLTELVPDAQQFADEVFAEVTARFGDDVVVYEYFATIW